MSEKKNALDDIAKVYDVTNKDSEFDFYYKQHHFEAIKKDIGYNSESANRARLTVTGVQLKYLVFLLSSNNNNRSDNDCLTKINCLAKTFILTT